MDLIIISIGALAKNPLWNEKVAVRTSHATTTLLRTSAVDNPKQELNLLIDPSLPGDILESRLGERAGLKPDQITHVFLTSWRPVHRRGLDKFRHAVWWMHPNEIEAATVALDAAERHYAAQNQAPDALIEKERTLLEKVQPAPDELADSVDLYPLFGYTPGQCGLLISQPTLTTLIAGDAVPTAAHFAAGQVFPDCWDLAKAKESLLELYEVADVIVPGHDNLFVAPRAAGL